MNANELRQVKDLVDGILVGKLFEDEIEYLKRVLAEREQLLAACKSMLAANGLEYVGPTFVTQMRSAITFAET